MYQEYLACDSTELQKELKRISTFYPLGIFLCGEKEYMLRNIIAIEQSGALILQGDIPENTQIRLMIGTKESCLNATEEAVSEVKNKLLGKPAEFILMFNSASRHKLLGRESYREIEIIKNSLGENTPFLGLYTYGEMAPLASLNYLGTTYFHNQTVTLLAGN